MQFGLQKQFASHSMQLSSSLQLMKLLAGKLSLKRAASHWQCLQDGFMSDVRIWSTWRSGLPGRYSPIKSNSLGWRGNRGKSFYWYIKSFWSYRRTSASLVLISS
jgi:hypothetical protein